MSYEFTNEEEEIISNVGLLSLGLAALIIVGAIMDLFLALNQFGDEGTAIIFGFVVIVVAQLIIGGVLYLPANNFRKIKETKGNDIDELMSGIEKLLLLTKVIIGGLMISIFVLLILFSRGA